MFAANRFAIRPATAQDEPALRRLAYLDGHLPLAGRVLVGEIAGVPAAAIDVEERRLVSDPFQDTGHLRAQLRIRAAALEAFEQTPSLRRRMLDGLKPAGSRRRARSLL